MNKNSIAKLAIGFGVTGVMAGIFLIFSEKNIIGFSSAIAGAGIVYAGFNQLKNSLKARESKNTRQKKTNCT